MTSLGGELRGDERWADAVDVARETMRRARSNVELLLEALPTIGYEFELEPECRLVPPSSSIGQDLDRLEARIGRLPLSLRCWYEEVGHVDLTGHQPDWDIEYLDPLVVDAPIDFVLSEYDMWLEDRGTEHDQGSAFSVAIAPDYLHKANVSGGMPYSIAVPDGGADGLLLWERHQTTFVNYLRIAFRWAGLPGLGLSGDYTWRHQPLLFPESLRLIAESLAPI
jgi:hypothetical protein